MLWSIYAPKDSQSPRLGMTNLLKTQDGLQDKPGLVLDQQEQPGSEQQGQGLI